MNIIGDVEDRNVFIVDDIIDTGGTLIQSVEALLRAGRAVDFRVLHARRPFRARHRPDQRLAPQHVVVTNSMPTADKASRVPAG